MAPGCTKENHKEKLSGLTCFQLYNILVPMAPMAPMNNTVIAKAMTPPMSEMTDNTKPAVRFPPI